MIDPTSSDWRKSPKGVIDHLDGLIALSKPKRGDYLSPTVLAWTSSIEAARDMIVALCQPSQVGAVDTFHGATAEQWYGKWLQAAQAFEAMHDAAPKAAPDDTDTSYEEKYATEARLAKPAATEKCDFCGASPGDLHAYDCMALDDPQAAPVPVEGEGRKAIYQAYWTVEGVWEDLTREQFDALEDTEAVTRVLYDVPPEQPAVGLEQFRPAVTRALMFANSKYQHDHFTSLLALIDGAKAGRAEGEE